MLAMSPPPPPHAVSNLGKPNPSPLPSHTLRHEQRQPYASRREWKAPLQDRLCLRPTSHATCRSPSPALTVASTAPSTMDCSSRTASSRRDSGSSYTTDFDDLYDISDEDDSAIVPLKCSNSMKQLLERSAVRRESLPSLVIPSPTAWPTIQKLRSAVSPRSPSSSAAKNHLSPAALARLNVMSLRVPTAISTPSLDGSLTSDEIASLSPATPDLRSKSPEPDWDAPIQLDPRAMDTLQQISLAFSPSPDLCPIIEVPETQVTEMQERGLNIDFAVSRHNNDDLQQPAPSEPISAISVPSPGGFMASLDLTSRKMWNVLQDVAQPSTTTAECFYDIPWDSHIREAVVEHVIDVDEGAESDGPPTARQDDFTSKPALQSPPTMEEKRQSEYDEEYDKKLSEVAASNMSRTSMWLSAQETYISALNDSNPLNALEPRVSSESVPTIAKTRLVPAAASPNISDPSSSPKKPSSNHASKKSVRFIESVAKTPVTAIHAPQEPRSDSLFYHAFQHLASVARPSDAFSHRHIRADAVQAQRLYLPDVHRMQLQGHYSIPVPPEPKKDFAHLPHAPGDPEVRKQREAVAQADRERQALAQISLAHWHLEATRMLSAGSLLPRTARDSLNAAQAKGRTPRLLDLGGLPTADWGWAVSMEQRNAKVYTVVVTPSTLTREESTSGMANAPWLTHRGPSNHRTLSVTRPWILPFPDASFDVVSARNLHALCRMVKADQPTIPSPTRQSKDLPFAADFGSAIPQTSSSSKSTPRLNNGIALDEYTAALSELHRVLVPGGSIHYTLLDAEITIASAAPPPLRPSVFGPSHPTHSLLPDLTESNTAPLHLLSAAFAASLREAYFDPVAGHTSKARLITAGFSAPDIHESWLELPVGGQGGHRMSRISPARASDEVADVCEVAGAVGWERWIFETASKRGVKEGCEFGEEGGAVSGALERARKAGGRCAWRMRVGVAVKGGEESRTKTGDAGRKDKGVSVGVPTGVGMSWI